MFTDECRFCLHSPDKKKTNMNTNRGTIPRVFLAPGLIIMEVPYYSAQWYIEEVLTYHVVLFAPFICADFILLETIYSKVRQWMRMGEYFAECNELITGMARRIQANVRYKRGNTKLWSLP